MSARDPMAVLDDNLVSIAERRHEVVVDALNEAWLAPRPIDVDAVADELLEALAGIGDPADATRR